MKRKQRRKPKPVTLDGALKRLSMTQKPKLRPGWWNVESDEVPYYEIHGTCSKDNSEHLDTLLYALKIIRPGDTHIGIKVGPSMRPDYPYPDQVVMAVVVKKRGKEVSVRRDGKARQRL